MTKRPLLKPERDFITRTGGPVGRDWRDAEEFHLERAANRLFKRAKFDVLEKRGEDHSDLVVLRTDLGKPKRYSVEVVADLTSKRAQAFVSRFMERIQQPDEEDDYDEYWLITNRLMDGRIKKERTSLHRRIRVLDIDELEKLLAGYEPQQQPKARVKRNVRTKIGKSVVTNEREITLAVAALLLQIEERIADLRSERPNSEEAIAKRDAAISEFERMQGELENIRRMVSQFTENKVKEANVVRSVNSFSDDVRSWWNKNHDRICDKAYDMSMFVTAVTICSLAGAAGNVSVAVSAALVGGKPVADAIKSIGRKLLAG